MVLVCLPEGARLKTSFQVVYLRLATFGGCFVLMQVAPADFLTYGYGSCTAKISGDTANSARRLWCTVGMLKPYMYHVFEPPMIHYHSQFVVYCCMCVCALLENITYTTDNT